MYENAKRFQRLVTEDPELRAKIQDAAAAFAGNKTDDQSVFDEIIAPIAREVGIELTFAEARRAAIESRALTDEDLELVVGGAGFLYSRIIAGTIAGLIPARKAANIRPIEALRAE